MSSFWLTLKQQWTIKIASPLFSILSLAAILVGSRDHRTHFWKGTIQESFQQSLVDIGSVVSKKNHFFKFHPPISIFCNSSHLGYRTVRTDTILKGTHPGTIPAMLGFIWLRGFRGEDLNVIFYQNMPNLHNRYISAERKMSNKTPEHMLNYSLPCSCSSNLSSFWLILKQQWTIEEISIFSNSSHLEWMARLSDRILKGTHPGTIPAKFGLIWFSGFRGEDLNVIFYQNMPNLHNRYISTERKISNENPEHMLNYSLPCSCS